MYQESDKVAKNQTSECVKQILFKAFIDSFLRQGWFQNKQQGRLTIYLWNRKRSIKHGHAVIKQLKTINLIGQVLKLMANVLELLKRLSLAFSWRRVAARAAASVALSTIFAWQICTWIGLLFFTEGGGSGQTCLSPSRRKLPFTFRFWFWLLAFVLLFGYAAFGLANSGLGVSGPVQPAWLDQSCDLLESRPVPVPRKLAHLVPVSLAADCLCIFFFFLMCWASAGCWPGQKKKPDSLPVELSKPLQLCYFIT